MLALALAAVFFAAGYFTGRAVTGDISVTVEEREDETPAATAENEGLVNINTASAAQLMALPGIGEALAQRVADYRAEHGPFRVKEELMNVPGVGEALADNILTYREEKGPFRAPEELMSVPGIGESLFSNLEEHITV